MKTFISIILSVLAIIAGCFVLSIKVFGLRILDILFLLLIISLTGLAVLALAEMIHDAIESWEWERKRRKHGSK